MKRILVPIVALIFAGCHSSAQVPPITHSATTTVTNAPCAAGTPAAQCGYVFSKQVLSPGAVSCGSTSGSNYTPLNPSSPVPQPATGNASYNDPSAAGETVCMIAQACQTNGTQCFQPSTAAGPATVLPNLTPPSLGTVTTAAVEKPAPVKVASPDANPQLAENQPAARIEVK